MEQFRNIGLIGRLESPGVIETLKTLKGFLVTEGYRVILEESTAVEFSDHGLQVSPLRLLGEICDLAIVVGGDGSILGAARALARHKVPVLGINRGRLGFLTDISPEEVPAKIIDVLAGKYIMESRFLLDTRLQRNGEPISSGRALNDVVLHPGQSTRMIEFELYIEGQFVYSQRSDGLIVSTPTGSTAYALSAGGPIMHPALDAIVLVPMFAHTLSSRPIVVGGSSEIKIVLGLENRFNLQISCDGQDHLTAAPGDVLYVHKYPHKLRIIHPVNHNFYEICRSKLGWGNLLERT